eukprot:CAMPEP_0170633070 /NCGR_PEP_ID=MMETSP0224-20130122/35727_1 /TAXON_ID=285029 /ORGANISM="Togula jolla, Strain CCCM 725" /LENGTH=64 /DNA_ID=CAMNT_0010961949 /DNA_START=172 /DNA_END=366 /DNA_ORIENTATION=-
MTSNAGQTPRGNSASEPLLRGLGRGCASRGSAPRDRTREGHCLSPLPAAALLPVAPWQLLRSPD